MEDFCHLSKILNLLLTYSLKLSILIYLTMFPLYIQFFEILYHLILEILKTCLAPPFDGRFIYQQNYYGQDQEI